MVKFTVLPLACAGIVALQRPPPRSVMAITVGGAPLVVFTTMSSMLTRGARVGCVTVPPAYWKRIRMFAVRSLASSV